MNKKTYYLVDCEFRYPKNKPLELVSEKIILSGSYDYCYEMFWKLYKKLHSVRITEDSIHGDIMFPT